MADQENVVIRLNSTANTRGVNQMTRSLLAMNAAGATSNSRLNAIGATTNQNTALINKNNKALAAAGKAFSSAGRSASFFLRVVGKVMKLALMGAALETLALAAALSSVNLLLKTGAALSRAYSATITGLGVAAANAVAGVAALVAIFTQAMRQFAAAQSSASYGGSFAGASQALRTMQADAQLAVFGLQALNSAFAAASKNARITGASVASIRGLSDFAIASGDMEKGLIAASNLVTLLQSGKGAGSAEVLNLAKELGSEFEEAYKKATASGKVSNKELLSMFASGELSKAAGIEGTAANVRGSFMGQLKTFATEFQVLFADIGQSFIGPIQRSFDQITKIFRRTVVQISGQLNLFAKGPFQNVIVAGIDKLGTFTAKLVNEYLPRTEEVLGKFGSWWTRTSNATKDMFGRMDRFLRRFSEASTEINKFFGGIFRRIGSEFGSSFENFASLAVDNKDDFQEFGRAIQDLIGAIFDLFRQIRTSFFAALPAINSIVGTLTSLIGALSTALAMLGSLGPMSGVGSLAGLVGLGAFGSKGRRRNRFRGRGAAGPGFVAGLATKAPMLALGASFIPSLLPQLGLGGDLASAAMIGALGGNMIKGMADKRYAAQVAAVAQQNAAIQAANKGRLPYQMQALIPDPQRKVKGVGRFGPGVRFAGAGAVAAGGALATSALTAGIENRFSNTAATVGSGMLGGAAAGAAAGAILAGPTLGLSVAVGAAVGAVIGGITGWMKSGEAKKQARNAGRSFAGSYVDEVTKLVQTGNIRDAEQAIAEFGTTLERVSKKVGRSSELRAAAEEEFKKRMDIVKPAVDMFNRNLRDLTTVTGLAEDQIIATAMAAEIDLSSNLLDLQEILTETGLVVGRFGQDFNNAMAMSLGKSVEAIQSKFRELEAPHVLNEAAQTFRELLEAGKVTDADRQRLLTTVYEQAALMYGRDPLAAAEFILENIGTAARPGGQFTTPGSVLFGKEADFFGGGGAALVQAGRSQTADDLRAIITENIISAVAAGGGVVSATEIQRSLEGMGLGNLIDLGRTVRNQDFLGNGLSLVRDEFGLRFETAGAQQTLEKLLGLQQNSLTIAQSDSSKITQSIDGLGLILKPLDDALAKFNKNIDKLIDAVTTGDTYSPRRNLVSTMSKHNSLDMSIAGKRTVTSSLRNTGLGSPSSDHAFGMAYDLTGQNLGAYQAAVRAGGGFAEFHGAGGSRHLHVVPGGAPMGDTATPVMAMSQPVGSTYSSSDSYTINVYPTEGMSPTEIANAVMDRIKREQRSSRERN